MVAINPRRQSATNGENHPHSKYDGKRNPLLRKFGSLVLKGLLIVTCFILYLVLVPPFVVAIAPLYIYRLGVICLAKAFKRGDLVKIVGPRDGVVGLDDVTQKCLCMLNVLCVVDGTPDVPAIREHFMKNVMDVEEESGGALGRKCYRKFKYYYESWMGYAFWKEEDNFRIERHVRLCEETEGILASQNDSEGGVIGEDALMRVLGDLATKPFPPKMSPWELLIVRNYVPKAPVVHTDYVPAVKDIPEWMKYDEESIKKEEGKQFVIVCRSHHALCDGYSLMKLIMVNWCGGPEESVPRAPVVRRSMWNKLLIYTGIVLLSPYYHLKQFVFDVDRNKWHISRNKLSREWLTIVSEKVPTKAIKEIGALHGVSTSSVLLAGLGGALRRYLEGTGEDIPKVMNSLAPMPWQGHPMNGLVNHWYVSICVKRKYGRLKMWSNDGWCGFRTLGFLSLPTGYDCPRKRLNVAHKSIQMLKTSPILLTNFVTVKFLQSAPLWLSSIWSTNWMTTAILSNFAGPDVVFPAFGKYPVRDVFFFLPQMRGTASKALLLGQD